MKLGSELISLIMVTPYLIPLIYPGFSTRFIIHFPAPSCPANHMYCPLDRVRQDGSEIHPTLPQVNRGHGLVIPELSGFLGQEIFRAWNSPTL